MNDLISIIIPIYNAEKYIDRCIESVIQQTYTNMEIICINDGSTDNTLQILNNYAYKDIRIKIIDKKNEGVSSARNYGINVSTGKYIAFVDCDDYIESNTIEYLYDIISQNNIDIVRGNYFVNYTDKEVTSNENIEILYNKIIEKKMIINEIVPMLMCGEINTYPVLLMIKKEILDKTCLFNIQIHFMEDKIFYIRLFLKANFIYISNKQLYHYVQNENSVTLKPIYYKRNICDILKVNNIIEEILNNNDINYKKEYYETMKAIHCKAIINYIYLMSINHEIDDFNTILDEEELVDFFKDLNKKRLNIYERIVIKLIKNKNKKILKIFFYIKYFIKLII